MAIQLGSLRVKEINDSVISVEQLKEAQDNNFDSILTWKVLNNSTSLVTKNYEFEFHAVRRGGYWSIVLKEGWINNVEVRIDGSQQPSLRALNRAVQVSFCLDSGYTKSPTENFLTEMSKHIKDLNYQGKNSATFYLQGGFSISRKDCLIADRELKVALGTFEGLGYSVSQPKIWVSPGNGYPASVIVEVQWGLTGYSSDVIYIPT